MKHFYKLLIFIFISNYSSDNQTDLIGTYEDPYMQILSNRLQSIQSTKEAYDMTDLSVINSSPTSHGSLLLHNQIKLYKAILKLIKNTNGRDIVLLELADRMIKYSERITIPTDNIELFERKRKTLSKTLSALDLAINRIVDR